MIHYIHAMEKMDLSPNQVQDDSQIAKRGGGEAIRRGRTGTR